MQRDLLETELTTEELQALKNKRTGMFVFQLSWIMAFVSLVVVNWQLSYSKDWLPAGAQRAHWLPGTLAALVLLTSVVLAQRALNAIRSDEHHAFMMQWTTAIALGAAFVAIMLFEWFAVSGASQYAQVFKLMTGFHMFHAVVIGAYMLVVRGNALQGAYDGLNFWAVEAGVKLWYFVFIAWMLFYVVLYWIAW
jgi:heme/copper-type cytochrome/quinol oxidase subunit 3